ncbi:hypothetical protein [Brevibacillus sp. SYSU BS000544]|uniref:hypothetical protein n=1 Tax=Brevibacillus sp. SYSU BS000544 TaxID=3416443 RepID=UPI003CE55C9D
MILSMHKPKLILFFCMALLVNMVAFIQPTVTHADEEDVELKIVDFKYLDKKTDKVGKEGETKADGEKDYHFQLTLDIPESLEIRELRLVTANSKGEETSNSKVWSTYIDWFLGVYQNDKLVLNDFSDTVGRFNGQVVLDMYAADDEKTFIDGQYFMIRLSTHQQDYFTKPFKFKKVLDLTPPIAKGGQGMVMVEEAEPFAWVTLKQKTDKGVTDFGSKQADSKGNVVFSNLPAGTGYYVYQTVNNIDSEPSVFVEVKEVPVLIDEKSVKTSTKFSSGKINVSVSGKVNDKSITKLSLQIGTNKAVTVKVKNGSFSYKKTFSAATLPEVAVITVKNAYGAEQTVEKTIEADLADDETVFVESEDGTWTVTGEWTSKAGKSLYVVFDKKVVQIKNPEIDEEGFLGSFEADEDQEDIVLIVVDSKGLFECIEL